MRFYRTLKTETSAVVNINAENEISFSISDAQGRSLMSGILHPHDAVSPNTPGALLTWSCQVPDITETINSKVYLTRLSVDALGNTTKSRSNGLGQTVQSVDQAGNISSVQYDAGGNAIVSRDPNNVGQDCVYDELGRRTQCTDTVGSVTKTGYDKSGQQITATDAQNKVTHYVYDARGRRRKETDRLTYPTEWTYDAAGNLLSLKDAENQITSYGYNDAGQRITEQYPDHVVGATIGQTGYGIITFGYDALGRRTSKQETTGAADRKGRMKAEGVSTTGVTSYNFDKQPSPPTDEGGCRTRAVVAKELLTRGYVGHASGPLAGQTNTDTFTYDRAGRMLSGVKGRYSNTITFTYDDRGQQTQETLTTHGQTYTVGYVKNVLGQTTRLVYPDGSLVDRAYTNRGQLQSVNYTPNGGTASSVATFTYDAGGRETQRNLGNGLTTTRSYFTDNQIQSIATPTVETLTYTYDANKNPTSETRSGVMAPYSWSTGTSGYDDEDRLVNWSRTNGDSQSWNLSPVHDWNTTTINGAVQSRTHGPAHELLTMAGAQVTNSPRSLTYDTKGNMTTDDRGCGMTWDFDNMLQSFAANGGTDLKNATYEYDAIGRRVAKNVAETGGTQTTVFVQAGQQVTCEYTPGNATTDCDRKYAYGKYIDEVLNFVDATAATEVRYWLSQNRQYSVYTTSSTTGALSESYRYDPFGKIQCVSSSGIQTGGAPLAGLAVTFTGRSLCNESGFLNFRSREFSVTCGHFLSTDTLDYIDGLSRYSGYFAIRSVDPFGMQCEECTVGTVEPNSMTATGIGTTNGGMKGNPGKIDNLDLTAKELQIWLQVLSIMESTKGAKTLQEVLQGVLEQYKPEGIGDVDTDKIQKLFDGIGEIVDVTRAKTIRFWITVKANCCVEGGFLFSNYYESHTYDYPCDDVFFNPAVATGSDEERLRLQQEIDKWISGGGITRCQKKAKEDFDCIKSDGGARLVEDPLKE